MTEEAFWRCFPRKLMALLKVHVEAVTGKRTDPYFIDEVLA